MIFFIAIITSIFTLLSNSIFAFSEFYFYSLIAIGLLDYYKNKSFTFFQVWQAAFVFIILSEALLTSINNSGMLLATKFLILANNIFILGYIVPQRLARFKTGDDKTYRLKPMKWAPLIFVVLVGLYVAYALPGRLAIFLYGRSGLSGTGGEGSSLLISGLSQSISYILPATIVFYYKEVLKKKSLFIPILISLPIFLVLLIGGTRFPLLFSLGGFLIVSQANTIKGKISISTRMILIVLLILIGTSFMKSFRASGYQGQSIFALPNQVNGNFTQMLATQMSPEGIVDMTDIMFDYFNNNPHTYGRSTLFLTYFWIPRSIWSDKPTMLGNWLIREYRNNFSDGHSSSFGFTGELFADFGYFSLVIVFLMGMLLKRADQFRVFQLSQTGVYPKLLVAMLFPYIFFFVRSPITATMNFIGILIAYYLFKKLIFRKAVKQS